MKRGRKPRRRRASKSRRKRPAGLLAGRVRRYFRLAVLAAAVLIGGGALVALLVAALSSPLFVIRHVRILGLERVSQEQVIERLQIGEKQNLFLFPASAAARRIEALPWIEWTKVRRQVPNRLVIEVGERRPVAVAVIGELHYVDSSGFVFAPLAPGEAADLPVITGIGRKEMESDPVGARGRIREGLRTLALLRAHPVLGSRSIAEVNTDPVKGLRVYFSGAETQIRLGEGDLEPKIERLAAVLKRLQSKDVTAASIDVGYKNRAIVRPASRSLRMAER